MNKARTGPRSVARFKPEVHPRNKLTKCPEHEEQQQQQDRYWLLGLQRLYRDI